MNPEFDGLTNAEMEFILAHFGSDRGDSKSITIPYRNIEELRASISSACADFSFRLGGAWGCLNEDEILILAMPVDTISIQSECYDLPVERQSLVQNLITGELFVSNVIDVISNGDKFSIDGVEYILLKFDIQTV
jgi:hypothetical protein